MLLTTFGMIVAGVWLIQLARHKTILFIEGQTRTRMTTSALTVGDLLVEQGIPVYAGDVVNPSMDHWLRPGDVISIERASWTYVEVERVSSWIHTTERLPANLLAEAGIKLYPGDQLFVDGELALPDKILPWRSTYSLQVIRARRFSIDIDGKQQTIYTTEQTIGRALAKAGIQVKVSDGISPTLETPIRDSTTVFIDRARRFAITSMGRTVHSLSAAETVGEALAEAGIALQGLDYSRPAPDTRLSEIPTRDDQEIRVEVFRVQESQYLEKEFIPFETEVQLLDDLEIDKTEIIQPGVFGMKIRRIRVRSVNGKEILRKVEDQYTALEPQNEIKGYGKKLIPHTLDTPDGTITYWRALNMYAVSYKPSSSGNFTSIGLPLRKGIAAVDTDYIAYGTRMYIPGYGFAIAGDTGGGVVGRLIDLGYSDEDYVSWHQWVTVYFLWPPPEVIAWIYP